jgi:hypothetical protein
VFHYIFCSVGKIKTVEDEAGVSVHFLFWRKNKTVEDEAATKDGIEVGDDDMTKDWNHGLMMIRKS